MSEQIPTNTNETVRTRQKKGKWKRRLLRAVLIFLLLALLCFGGLILYQQLNQGSHVTYQSYTATEGTISNALSFSGSLQLINSDTYTAEGAGDVRAVYVQVGDSVTSGQKLLRLSSGQTVTAAFDGRVNQLLVAQGDTVSQGDSLVQIADFDHMKVSIRVDEYDISDVHVGQTCRVTMTATEQTVETTIDAINYISVSAGNVAYYTATAYVDVPEGVYPGMQATISIPQEEAQDVVILRLDAISFDETNQAYVLRQLADGTMEQVTITTGVSNGNYVEIKSGLNAGDIVYARSEEKSSSTSLLDGLFNFSTPQQQTQTNRQKSPDFVFPGGEKTQRNGGGSQGGGGR